MRTFSLSAESAQALLSVGSWHKNKRLQGHTAGSKVACPAGYPQGLILKELAEYTLSHGVQKLLKSWYFGALPAKVTHLPVHISGPHQLVVGYSHALCWI